MKDKVSSTDHVQAQLSTEVVAPNYPCPLCGKETKDNNTEESREAGQDLRICSNRACRSHTDWASGRGALFN